MSPGTDVLVSAFLRQGTILIPDPTQEGQFVELGVQGQFDTVLFQETVPAGDTALFTSDLLEGFSFVSSLVHAFAELPVTVTLLPDGDDRLAVSFAVFDPRDIPTVPVVSAREFVQIRVDNTANGVPVNVSVELDGVRVADDRFDDLFSIGTAAIRAPIDASFIELVRIRTALGEILQALAADLPPEEQERLKKVIDDILITPRPPCPIPGGEE